MREALISSISSSVGESVAELGALIGVELATKVTQKYGGGCGFNSRKGSSEPLV
jgi:hypothetical protein